MKTLKNKLLECKAFVDFVGKNSADLEDEFLFLSFAGFCVTMKRKRGNSVLSILLKCSGWPRIGCPL